jgi:diketogulonate reductase-like aldo/keto reductase
MKASSAPRLIYGTAWKEERTEELTALALTAGFRAIDTANQRKHYFEAAVGAAVQRALADGQLSRAELFLQSKFTFRSGQDHRLPYDAQASIAVQVEQSLQSSLEHFRTSYLDSFVLHGPSTREGLAAADVEAWRALESAAESGRARQLGVSNVSLDQLRELIRISRVKPSFVQNRCYARTGWDRAVRQVCAEHGVVYQPFSLLTANRAELDSPEVLALAARRGCSVAEVVFAFAACRGMAPLTGTSNVEHMRLDLRAVELELSAAELRVLEG